MCAEKLLQFFSSNKITSSVFAKAIVGSLDDCFRESRSIRVAREKMWENYYKVRSSDEFQDAWTENLKNIECKACPIFFQFVTDRMMESLIIEHYPLGLHAPCMSVAPLDNEEISALRYTAGYVIHSLQKKVKKMAHPLNKEVLWCLMEMAENHGSYIIQVC